MAKQIRRRDGRGGGKRCLALLRAADDALPTFLFAFSPLPSLSGNRPTNDSEDAGVEYAPRSTSRSGRSSERKSKRRGLKGALSLSLLSLSLSLKTQTRKEREGGGREREKNRGEKVRKKHKFFFLKKLESTFRFPVARTTLSILHLSSSLREGVEGTSLALQLLARKLHHKTRRGEELKRKARKKKKKTSSSRHPHTPPPPPPTTTATTPN